MRLNIVNPQIAQKPFKSNPVSNRIVPVPEIPNINDAPYICRPGFICLKNSIVQSNGGKTECFCL